MSKRRYNLVLPTELYNEVEKIATANNTTVLEVMRKFVRIGLIAAKISETPGAALFIRQGDSEREIIFI